MLNYDNFIEQKRTKVEWFGFTPKTLNANLFDFQRDIVKWACEKGRAATASGKNAKLIVT